MGNSIGISRVRVYERERPGKGAILYARGEFPTRGRANLEFPAGAAEKSVCGGLPVVWEDGGWGFEAMTWQCGFRFPGF
ncbi:hypothetical protein NL676_025485 [Syzygium grande]|nr:hypothetical protein NL676_025485 [Syzygium grande]